MAGPVEGGAHPPSFLAHQSPQFQHEFPKLSSGDGQAPATGQKGGSDTQYGPGPSLRPQSEYMVVISILLSFNERLSVSNFLDIICHPGLI
jgi:hypothetical protein